MHNTDDDHQLSENGKTEETFNSRMPSKLEYTQRIPRNSPTPHVRP